MTFFDTVLEINFSVTPIHTNHCIKYLIKHLSKDYDLDLITAKRDMRMGLQRGNFNDKGRCLRNHEQGESLISIHLYS